ncbi:3217_t:CDS:2 [Funneliformis geosporum]|uniref:3217_t:CDS:1 n=1 Tax=Funneliformis geosporum TaxID=1117311 RepID=A0A9W4ST72_9GLOM|nr:3217_t:CDS:2 [Funneliformis geosporum]
MGVILCKPKISKTEFVGSNQSLILSNQSISESTESTDDTNYIFPNNDDEADRINTQHFTYHALWGRNYSAPVDKLLEGGAEVLDVGCGPGTWTLDMGERFPASKFTGIDLRPTYPELIKPSNVSFVQANVLQDLPFKDNTFDYVYMRFMMFALTFDDWETALKEIIRVCRPNGWIELMEGQKTAQLRMAIVKEMKKRNIENLENLKWGAKNLANAVKSNLLLKDDDDKAEGKDDSKYDELYDKMVNDFFEECKKGETFVISHRFFMLNNVGNVPL